MADAHTPTPEDVEAVARAMCARYGIDPEATVYFGPPVQLLFGYHYYTPSGQARPGWRIFEDVATVALAVVHESKEAPLG